MPVPWNEKELQLFLGAPPRGGHVRVLRTATCFNCTIRHVALFKCTLQDVRHVYRGVGGVVITWVSLQTLKFFGFCMRGVRNPGSYFLGQEINCRSKPPNLQRGLVQFSTKFRQSLVTLKPENVSFAVCQLNRVKFKCSMLRFH